MIVLDRSRTMQFEDMLLITYSYYICRLKNVPLSNAKFTNSAGSQENRWQTHLSAWTRTSMCTLLTIYAVESATFQIYSTSIVISEYLYPRETSI